MSKLAFLRDEQVLDLAAEIAMQGECQGPGMVDASDLPCGPDCSCCEAARLELHGTAPRGEP